MIDQWAVIIEQAYDEPRIVIFDNCAKAEAFVEAKNNLTEQTWGGDPEWHNYCSGPIRVTSMSEESQRIWVEACEAQGV